MPRLTLAEARSALSPFAGQCGMSTDDDRVDGLINYIQQTLMPELNHPEIVDPIRFCNYGNCITLPSTHDVALRITAKNNLSPIASMWYEFSEYGPGRQDGQYGWAAVPIDAGESPIVNNPDICDDGGGQILRVFSGADERVDGDAPYITVFGEDIYGRPLLINESGVLTNGLQIPLNGHSSTNYADSPVKLRRVSGVIKPITRGMVELFWIDSTGASRFCARYQPSDTKPSYRRYRCPGANNSGDFMSVHAICRKRFRTISDDNDPLFLSNIRALRMGVRAAAEEIKEGGDPDRWWSMAVATLRAEAEAWYGDQMGRVEYAPETGFGEECPVI